MQAFKTTMSHQIDALTAAPRLGRYHAITCKVRYHAIDRFALETGVYAQQPACEVAVSDTLVRGNAATGWT